jgi:hypothetical protein
MGDKREHHEHRRIQTDEYEGPDRRHFAPNGRRFPDAITRSLPLLGFLVVVVTGAVSAGISYGTTQAQLQSLDRAKVNRDEWIQKNADQDRQREELREIVLGLRTSLEQVAPEVKELNDRLKQFYCEGKPSTCR